MRTEHYRHAPAPMDPETTRPSADASLSGGGICGDDGLERRERWNWLTPRLARDPLVPRLRPPTRRLAALRGSTKLKGVTEATGEGKSVHTTPGC